MKKIFELFITFARIGLFTFGGGYAMISIIENTCIEKKKWITHDEMANITIIAESTPGPISINCSTYVGYKQMGLIGAIVSTFGMVLPSFCIILLISTFLDNFLEIGWVAHAFKGIKIAVGILITDVAVKMIRKSDKKPLSIIILICSFAVMMTVNILSVRISTIVIMLTAGAVSLIVYLIRQGGAKGGTK